MHLPLIYSLLDSRKQCEETPKASFTVENQSIQLHPSLNRNSAIQLGDDEFNFSTAPSTSFYWQHAGTLLLRFRREGNEEKIAISSQLIGNCDSNLESEYSFFLLAASSTTTTTSSATDDHPSIAFLQIRFHPSALFKRPRRVI